MLDSQKTQPYYYII